MSLGEANETMKQLVREWKREFERGLYSTPTIQWKPIHNVLDSMTAFLGDSKE